MQPTPEKQHKTRDLSRFIAITALNGAVMLFAGARGVSAADGALLAEMAHDMGDTGVSAARAVEYGREESKVNLARFRKLTYFIVSSLGIITAAKSGFEFANVVSSLDGFNAVPENMNRIVDGVVIAGVNQASYSVSQDFEDPASDLVHDAKHHSKVDRNASLGLAACLVTGSLVPGVAEIGGMGIGIYTAWHMRPTQQNLANHSHSEIG